MRRPVGRLNAKTIGSPQNLADFAYNLDPTLGETRTLEPATGTRGLPYWEVTTSNGLSVEYLRRKNAAGLTYAVGFSDNLLSWDPPLLPESITPINSTWERVVVPDSVSPADAASRFGRVTVEQE